MHQKGFPQPRGQARQKDRRRLLQEQEHQTDRRPQPWGQAELIRQMDPHHQRLVLELIDHQKYRQTASRLGFA